MAHPVLAVFRTGGSRQVCLDGISFVLHSADSLVEFLDVLFQASDFILQLGLIFVQRLIILLQKLYPFVFGPAVLPSAQMVNLSSSKNILHVQWGKDFAEASASTSEASDYLLDYFIGARTLDLVWRYVSMAFRFSWPSEVESREVDADRAFSATEAFTYEVVKFLVYF
jgi:hypothetical protein